MSDIDIINNLTHVNSGMMNPVTNLKKVEQHLKSIENGDFTYIVNLFSPDAVLEQLPNRIYPNGIRSGVSRMAEAFEKGRKLLSRQSYEIKSCIVDGDELSIKVLWTGTLAVSFGSLSVGSKMRAHSAMFFRFKDGKIVSQRNYDCFEPW
jgi:ketosteroid isomerase-like protein